jgi:hypothetical protein
MNGASFTLLKTTKSGDYAPRNGFECEGRMRQEHSGDQHRRVFRRDGHQVCIADYDPQRSSLDWLAQRPADLPAISGVAAFDEGCATWRATPRSW